MRVNLPAAPKQAKPKSLREEERIIPSGLYAKNTNLFYEEIRMYLHSTFDQNYFLMMNPEFSFLDLRLYLSHSMFCPTCDVGLFKFGFNISQF